MNLFIENKYSFLLLLLLFACNPWSSETEKALKLAGDNRNELEHVLRHYREVKPDPMKFRAAEYLISNMTYRHSIFGPGIDSLNKGHEDVCGVYTYDRNAVYSSDCGRRKLNGERDAEYDQVRVHAAQLIDQIDAAFETYDRFDWARQ